MHTNLLKINLMFSWNVTVGQRGPKSLCLYFIIVLKHLGYFFAHFYTDIVSVLRLRKRAHRDKCQLLSGLSSQAICQHY